MGSVGEDLFGDFILRALDSEGVDTSGVGRQQPPTRTSLAFVEIGADGDREFTFYRSSPAADELLSPEDVAEDLVSGASFVNFGSIPLIREPVRSATHRIAELARQLDVPVAFDVNFREHLWESAEAAREAVDPLLDLSTIVKLGDDELSPLLGTDDIEEAAGMLLDRGVSLVLVSKGPEGAFYATSEFSGEVPTFDVGEIVDATGAGDAFLAPLVHLSDIPLEEALVREATLRGCAPAPSPAPTTAPCAPCRRIKSSNSSWTPTPETPVTRRGGFETRPNKVREPPHTNRSSAEPG